MSLSPAALGIWLINLPRSTARREQMEARLERLGLDYRLFPAVDGRAEWDRLLPDLDLAGFSRNVGRDVMPGEVGCYHSHLGVWRALLDSPYEVALVLEDDVVFHDDFPAALQVALETADQWDILKLNSIRAKRPRTLAAAGPYRLCVFAGPLTGTGAYLINRKTAARFLKDFVPLRRPVDHQIDRSHLAGVRHLGLLPFPSHVDDGNESTITGTGFSGVRKYPAWRRLPYYLGKLRHRVGKAVHARRMGRSDP